MKIYSRHFGDLMELVWAVFQRIMIVSILLYLGFVLVGCGNQAKSKNEALDYAFKFAHAIVSDPKDSLKAQEKVVQSYLELGMIDSAIRYADQIKGWRQGTAYADIARAFGKKGNHDQCKKYIDKAAVVAMETKERSRDITSGLVGWESTRILTHMAQAYAELGKIRKTQELTEYLPKEEAAKVFSTIAWSVSLKGSYSQAMEMLKALDDSKEFEVKVARADGYLEIAARKELSHEQRLAALDQALSVAEKLTIIKKTEFFLRIVDLKRELNDSQVARNLLDKLEKEILNTEMQAFWKAPLLSELAVAYGKIDDRPHALDLIIQARKYVSSMQDIERPQGYAKVAEAYSVVGKSEESKELYIQSLDVAQTLVNSRPRALAVVDICCSLGKQKSDLTPQVRTRLEQLLSGLKSPW